MNATLLAVAMTVAATLASPSLAGPAVTDIPTSYSTYANCTGFTCGFRFSADSALTVTALGAYDQLADGLSGTPSVGLWSDDGSLLASVVIQTGTASTLVEAFRYEDIAPLALNAGAFYRVGVFGVDFTPTPGSDGNPAATFDGITPAGGYFASGSLTFPSTLDTFLGGRTFLGANLLFGDADVPEPAALGLLGLAIMSLAAARRRLA